jgi:uncharacterized protein YbjT (DUF2867 family)
MDAITVLVAGGTGFVGSHLVAKLAATGARVIVPTRRYENAKHLIFLPRVEVVETDINDAAACQRLTRRMDAVVNLVGILHSRPGTPYGPDFAKAHVELPRQLVAACAASHVKRYLHMSALGAASDGPSMYLRSKADGELAARANPKVAATIFRPSVIFGQGDKFLNLFAAMQSLLPAVPLGGADTRFQPVYVEDVAQAFVNALADPHTRRQTYELAGPKVYTLAEIVQLAGAVSGHARPVIKLGPGLARLQALVLEHLPGGPLMSRDNLDSMKVDNILMPESSAPTASALGIVPTALEAVLHHYLGQPLPRFDQYRGRAGR